MFKNKAKYIAVFIAGAIIGCMATFYYSANLSREIQEQTILSALINSISMKTIVANETDINKMNCFLLRSANGDAGEIRDKIEWLENRSIKYSGLNDIYVRDAKNAINMYNKEAKEKLLKRCNET